MAHEVETMFSVKETPWHGLGIVVHEAPTTEQAIELAGLNWHVKTHELFTGEGIKVDEKALLRSDNNKVLGVVGPRYEPLQNQEAFSFFNPFLSSKECTLETAGSLREGKRIWILAALNRAPIEIVKDDVVKQFLLLSNAHDGTMAVRVGFTPIRVVCANTLAMAHNDKQSKLIRIWHSKNVKTNLDNVQDIVNAANAEFEATAEQYKRLAKCEVNSQDLKNYVKIVFSLSEATSEREQVAQAKLQDKIAALFEYGRGNNMPGVKGTMWAAYNAVTEYLNYEAGTLRNTKQSVLEKADTRLNNVWFGQGKNISEEALKVAIKVAA